jgi:hypothetical protein
VGSLGRDPKVTDGSFTKEDALDLMKEKMIFNGRRKLEDLQKRVQEYIEKEELNLSKDMDKKFVAYLAQKIPKSTE